LIDPNFLLNSLFKLEQKDSGKKIFPELDASLNYSYDSYMLTDDSIQYRHQRLLRVDNKLYLPIQTNIRLLITSADVLHS
jgi:cytochrome c oxidase subunit 2